MRRCHPEIAILKRTTTTSNMEISSSLPHIDDSDEQPRLQVIACKLSGGEQPLPKERQAHTDEVGFEPVSLRTEDKVPRSKEENS
ncbi:hypothetical protein RIF29_18187 [Crotalaria pallida]|uniref:Uncharacterized protein n=1 Tax=Crotalaria pallida TaxID=3830 RepID=A0AAN9FS88_CROPI